ncbi:MAG: VanZ family protein [Alphaproteobacteria bacterium]|nr:VanZ family protein [Alphaproteobacteria bacterium]
MGVGLALATALLAWSASRTPASLPDGAPLLAELPGSSWVVEGPGTLTVEDGRALLRAGPCPPASPCRVTIARDVELPAEGRWLVEVDLERRRATDRNRVFLLDPTTGWHAGHGAFVLDRPEHRAVDAVAGPGVVRVGLMARGDGEAVAAGPVLVTAARRSWWHEAWWWGALAAAVAGGLVAAVAAWRSFDTVARAAFLALGAAFVAGVMAPRELLDRWLLLLPGVRPEDLQAHLLEDPTLPVVLQKIGGHALGFALLGALGGRVGAGALPVAVRLLAFAVATEGLQLLLPGRSGRWQDVALDLCGGLVGYGLSRVAAPRAPRASAASRP